MRYEDKERTKRIESKILQTQIKEFEAALLRLQKEYYRKLYDIPTPEMIEARDMAKGRHVFVRHPGGNFARSLDECDPCWVCSKKDETKGPLDPIHILNIKSEGCVVMVQLRIAE